jgi:hypothetical protein
MKGVPEHHNEAEDSFTVVITAYIRGSPEVELGE